MREASLTTVGRHRMKGTQGTFAKLGDLLACFMSRKEGENRGRWKAYDTLEELTVKDRLALALLVEPPPGGTR